jgi:Asp-tRNA(Asn)/Glu-tRNA(Gln) amidotransferase C subunit
MDLEKLAKLSCLDIKEEDRAYFSNSLADVVEIMDKVAGLDCNTTNDNLTQTVIFDSLDEDTISESTHLKESTLIDREEKYMGIHLEQGVFLAPKVIKKD